MARTWGHRTHSSNTHDWLLGDSDNQIHTHDTLECFDDQDFYVGSSNMPPQLFVDEDMTETSCPPTPDLTSLHNRSMNRSAVDKVSDQHGPTDHMDFEDRLNESMPFDDGSIAFGTIRIYEHEDPATGRTSTYLRGTNDDDAYPNLLIQHAKNTRTIRLDGLSVGTKSGVTSMRVYILPEDIDRSNRASVRDFHKLVRYLLQYVDCTAAAWTGQAGPHGPIKTYREPTYDSEESLFYMFNTLRSPDADTKTYKGSNAGLLAMLDALNGKIEGLKTTLYQYQKRSVAAMAKKEADPAKIRDPRKIRMLDIYGNVFYLDPKDGSLFRNQPLYFEPRGGILAETMGYGKTLICLALILATRGHYPAVPHYCMEIASEGEQETTPSLLSMAARRLKHEGIPWKNAFYLLKKEGYYHERCIEELQKYERSYNEPVVGTMNPTRKGKAEYSNIVRLCSATLIIVPSNLLRQWQQEMKQHIDKDAIDVLVIDTPGTLVPAWTELVKYDVILITKSRFEQEYRDDDLNQGKGDRYANKYKSPLTEVRWLRVICDEGHGFAGSSTKTNAMAMLDKMFIERRWVVSGTPSSSLHGVEVSLASVESDSTVLSSSRRLSFGSALEQKRIPVSQDSEAKDLEKLRLIVVKFLKLQPWANKKGDIADWKKYLAPRLNQDGRRHSMPALREVMQTLVIRHQIVDVDRDLTLPALHNRVVYLEPAFYDKLTVNLFVMVLASNYVSSEREDEDYIFHPRNRGKLTTLTTNLGYATFYWIGFTRQNVQDTVDVSNSYLNKSYDKVSDADGALLMEAIMNGDRALADPGWNAFSTLHEMGVYISRFPDNAKAAWALDSADAEPLLLGTSQAREVQKHVRARVAKNPSEPTFGLKTYGVKTMAAARNKAEEYQKQRQKQKINTEQKDVGAVEVAKKAPTTSSSAKANSRAETTGPDSITTSQASTMTTEALPDAEVVGFASAKLTYLCDRLLSHPDEKSIIFYNHNNVAFFIAEALELLRIPFLIYANTLKVEKRAEYLAKFNVDDKTKVLLMDLKQAGQGLHVAAASRVYITSPIWNQALESQAIKRAHRIGQKREVFVETLVLKGTFEEALVKRKKERVEQEGNAARDHTGATPPDTTEPSATTQSTKKSRGTPSNPMLDDSVMVKVLKDIRFLKISDDEEKFARLSTPMPLFATQFRAASSPVATPQQQEDATQDPVPAPSNAPAPPEQHEGTSQESEPESLEAIVKLVGTMVKSQDSGSGSGSGSSSNTWESATAMTSIFGQSKAKIVRKRDLRPDEEGDEDEGSSAGLLGSPKRARVRFGDSN